MNDIFSLIQFIISVIGPVILMTAPEDEDPPGPPNPDPPPEDPGDDGGSGGGGGSISVTTGSLTGPISMTVNGASSTAEYKGAGSYSGNTGSHSIRRRIYVYVDGVRTYTTNNGTKTVTSSSWNSTSNGQSTHDVVADDNTMSWRARAFDLNFSEEVNGSIKYFKSGAIPVTSSNPTVTTIGATDAGLNVDFFPNTKHSTATCELQYKLTSEPTEWTRAGDAATTGGYSEVTMIRGVTGLIPETSYDVRLVVTRNSVNNTSFVSNTVSFNTIAANATVTTDAASSIGFASAILNATVDHNTENGALSWRYILTGSYSAPPDDVQGTEVVNADNPVITDGTHSKITGALSAGTGYTFWAIYEPTVSGTKVYGDALTFTTAADPGQEAADGEMLPVQDFDRKWGVATTLFFVVPSEAGTSSDLLYDGAAPWTTGEAKITGVVYDDDSTPTVTGEANTASDPAREGSTPLYRLDLSASEMQHDELFITITDAGAAVRDVLLRVRTHVMLSTIDMDASAKSTNTTAATFTGNGTGAGVSFVGGDNDGKDIDGVLANHTLNYGTVAAYNSTTSVDLDNSTAIQTDDFYNGAVILFYEGGTGPGQARVITDYTGSSYEAVLNKALNTAVNTSTKYIIIPGADVWQIGPGAELGALPTITSNYADFLQFLFQRLAYKRTQTATEFKMFEDDSSTAFATNAVDDDGSVQTHNISVDA